MKNSLAIFIVLGIAAGVSVGVANHSLPRWTAWGVMAGVLLRILAQPVFRNKKF